MREVVEKTWGWNEAFQRSQFDHRFREHVVSVIESDGRAVGGLFLEDLADAIYIHEIQILPEHQGRGVGSEVIRHLIDQAGRRGAGVTLSVVVTNPRAKQLYDRLGFTVTAFEPPFFRMRRD